MSNLNWLKEYLQSEIELEQHRVNLITNLTDRMYHYGLHNGFAEVLSKIEKVENTK